MGGAIHALRVLFPSAGALVGGRPARLRYSIRVDDAQPALPFPAPRRIWSVSSLLAALKLTLDRDFFDVWIEGEVSNWHQAASRHCYFTLKDARGQLRAVLFAQQARLLRFRPADGLQVLVRGRLSLFETRGDLQLYAEHLEPLGRGDLQLAFEQLKEKLEAEGLFAPARKRALPQLPRRIALVTSPRGAAVADLLQILRRRYPNLEIRLYPVAVQGEAAVGEICAALAWFTQPQPGWRPDLLILARGGGSLEDLWAFNTEAVARALAAVPVPTIAAIGHETDFTIADFVADLRAPTPSAAAELAVRQKSDLLAAQQAWVRRLAQAAGLGLLRRRRRLQELAGHRGFQAMHLALAKRAQRVDDLQHSLEIAMRARLQVANRRLASATSGIQHRDLRSRLSAARARLKDRPLALERAWRTRLLGWRHAVDRGEELLRERNPLQVLARGYALVYDAAGRLATSPAAIAEGERLRIRFAEGSLEAEAKARRS